MEKINGRLTSTLLLLSIFCIWVLMVILVNPIGDFPLNDDWGFGRPVKTLVEKGSLQFAGWQTMTLIAHVLWGTLFCLPFGFSFTVLRISTLLLGLVGAFAIYGLLREIKISKTIALIGTLVVVTNPIYFELSNTFMTDIPFFTFSMLSFLFFIRGIQRDRNTEFLIGSLIACVATLIRQFGIVIPLSFGITILFKNGINKKTVKTALMPAIIVLVTLILYLWLQSVLGLPVSKVHQGRLISRLTGGFFHLTSDMTINLLKGFIYLGLFLLPFSIIIIPNIWKTLCNREKLLFYLASSIFFVAITGVLFWENKLMPLLENIIFDVGLGPVILRDVTIHKLPHWPTAPKILWIFITIGGIVGASLLVGFIVSIGLRLLLRDKRGKYKTKNWFVIFMSSALIPYFMFIAILGVMGINDRYLIFLIPLLMIIIASMVSEATIRTRFSWLSTTITVGLIVFYGIFAVGATHDYLSWNRARWKALDYLTEEAQISPFDIDGGFEFNGWYKYTPEISQLPRSDKLRWWFNKDVDYVITLGYINGYEEIRRYPFERWIPYGQGSIFILHKAIDSKNGQSTRKAISQVDKGSKNTKQTIYIDRGGNKK